MPPRELKWLEINDFRPGIQQRVGDLAAQGMPLGSATDNTSGCFAAPNGSLQPLPKPIAYYDPTPPDNFVDVKDGTYYISGFHITGPITGAAVGSGAQSEFHIAYEWIKEAGAPNPHKEYRWERHQIFANPVVIDTIHSYAGAVAPTEDAVRGTFFADVRMHPTTATDPGYPLVAGGWWDSDDAVSFVHVYPDPAAPNTNNPANISTTLPPDIIVAHQGRLIIFEQRSWDHGSPGAWISNEQIWFTNINLDTIEPTVAQTFSTDRMTGIGVAESVSASEFLMVKFQGGAFAVSGDFSNPTVIRLPGVMPTYGATVVPVYTAMGLVYASLNGGVYAWSGGSASQLLSSVLEDGFWQVPDLAPWINYHGQFELWREWIVVPNGWLFDTKTGGWWRLDGTNDDPSFFHYASDYTGTLFAVRSQHQTTDNLVDSFSWGELNESYYWESNYLPNVIVPGRGITVREVVVEAAGVGTVTIGLTAGVASGDQATAVAVNSTVPAIARRSCSRELEGNVSISITAAGSGGGDAPTVYSVKIGYYESTPVNRT